MMKVLNFILNWLAFGGLTLVAAFVTVVISTVVNLIKHPGLEQYLTREIDRISDSENSFTLINFIVAIATWPVFTMVVLVTWKREVLNPAIEELNQDLRYQE